MTDYNYTTQEPNEGKVLQEYHDEKKLCRSNTDFIFGGICGGFAEYNSTDPFWIRTILSFSLLLTPWAFVVYIIAFFFLPLSSKSVDKITLNKKMMSNKYFFFGILFLLITANYLGEFLDIQNDSKFILFSDQFAVSSLILFAGIYNMFFAETSDEKTNEKKFFRSLNDKKLIGVCSGFAKFYNLDTLLVRFIALILTLLTFGLFIIIYFYIGMRTEGKNEIIL